MIGKFISEDDHRERKIESVGAVVRGGGILSLPVRILALYLVRYVLVCWYCSCCMSVHVTYHGWMDRMIFGPVGYLAFAIRGTVVSCTPYSTADYYYYSIFNYTAAIGHLILYRLDSTRHVTADRQATREDYNGAKCNKGAYYIHTMLWLGAGRETEEDYHSYSHVVSPLLFHTERKASLQHYYSLHTTVCRSEVRLQLNMHATNGTAIFLWRRLCLFSS